MRSIQDWLSEYGESHQNPVNKAIHWVCVPLIMLTLIGLIWSIPVPEIFLSAPFPLNWGVIFLFFCWLFYLRLSFSLAIGMFVMAALMAVGIWAFTLQTLVPLWLACLVVFALAWVFQFIGHAKEGKKPSFFKDIQFLLIGPAWVLTFLYNKLGIKY